MSVASTTMSDISRAVQFEQRVIEMLKSAVDTMVSFTTDEKNNLNLALNIGQYENFYMQYCELADVKKSVEIDKHYDAIYKGVQLLFENQYDYTFASNYPYKQTLFYPFDDIKK